MDKRHHYVPIQELCPGMILGEDLLDKGGHVLLPKGAVLTAQMLKSLLQHGIHHISIHQTDVKSKVKSKDVSADYPQAQADQNGLSGSSDSSELSEQNQQAERLNHLFRHALDDTPNQRLFSYLQKYRAQVKS